MKLCDILGVGVGVKTYSDPPTYFRGGGSGSQPLHDLRLSWAVLNSKQYIRHRLRYCVLQHQQAYGKSNSLNLIVKYTAINNSRPTILKPLDAIYGLLRIFDVSAEVL